MGGYTKVSRMKGSLTISVTSPKGSTETVVQGKLKPEKMHFATLHSNLNRFSASGSTSAYERESYLGGLSDRRRNLTFDSHKSGEQKTSRRRMSAKQIPLEDTPPPTRCPSKVPALVKLDSL